MTKPFPLDVTNQGSPSKSRKKDPPAESVTAPVKPVEASLNVMVVAALETINILNTRTVCDVNPAMSVVSPVEAVLIVVLEKMVAVGVAKLNLPMVADPAPIVTEGLPLIVTVATLTEVAFTFGVPDICTVLLDPSIMKDPRRLAFVPCVTVLVQDPDCETAGVPDIVAVTGCDTPLKVTVEAFTFVELTFQIPL